MYSEILKHENKNTFKFIIILFLALVLLTVFSNYLYEKFHLVYITYTTFIVFVLVAIYVYRKKITNYRYIINDGSIIFQKVAGKRVVPMFSISFKDIIYFTALPTERDYDKVDKSIYALFDKNSKDAYVLVAKYDDKIYRVVFEPTAKFVDLIMEKLR
ncbi:MAG: hypothetical protein ACFWUE_08585 [Xylanivirga thermophila]|jgi:hypothetical protein|nr:hypothetical protein [Xylanivirga thermophila]